MTTGAKLTVILAVALVLLAVVYFLVFVPQGDLPIRAVDPQMSEGQVQDAAILGTDATLLENSRAVPAAAVIPPATPILATLMPPTVALATVGGPSSNVTWQIVSSAENDEEPASELEYYATSRVSETTGGRVSAVVSNPGASIEISNTAVTGRLYTINPGDTLSDISLAWFGTSLRWQDILDANPGLNPKRDAGWASDYASCKTPASFSWPARCIRPTQGGFAWHLHCSIWRLSDNNCPG